MAKKGYSFGALVDKVEADKIEVDGKIADTVSRTAVNETNIINHKKIIDSNTSRITAAENKSTSDKTELLDRINTNASGIANNKTSSAVNKAEVDTLKEKFIIIPATNGANVRIHSGGNINISSGESHIEAENLIGVTEETLNFSSDSDIVFRSTMQNVANTRTYRMDGNGDFHTHRFVRTGNGDEAAISGGLVFRKSAVDNYHRVCSNTTNIRNWLNVADKDTSYNYIRDLTLNDNLNNITLTGIYHNDSNMFATTANNYPVALAGKLEVLAKGAMVYQEYITFSTNVLYVRCKYYDAWSSWKQFVDTELTATTSRAGITQLGMSGTSNSVAATCGYVAAVDTDQNFKKHFNMGSSGDGYNSPAPMYAARAWLTLSNLGGRYSLHSNQNISRLIDKGMGGVFDVVFAIPMIHKYYSLSLSGRNHMDGLGGWVSEYGPGDLVYGRDASGFTAVHSHSNGNAAWNSMLTATIFCN